jgi:hypothetical protein
MDILIEMNLKHDSIDGMICCLSSDDDYGNIPRQCINLPKVISCTYRYKRDASRVDGTDESNEACYNRK